MLFFGLLLPAPFVLGDTFNLTFRYGWNLVANQLDRGSNRLNDIFPGFPSGEKYYSLGNIVIVSRVSPTDPRSYVVFTNGQQIQGPPYSLPIWDYFLKDFEWTATDMDTFAESWSAPNLIISPGDGFLLFYPWDYVSNPYFPLQGTPRVPSGRRVEIPAGGCYLLAAETLTNGTYQTVVGAPPMEGMRVYRLNPDGDVGHFGPPDYTVYTYANGAWSPEEPVLNLGESAWYCAPAPPLNMRVTNHVAVLSWPANSIDYKLEWASNPGVSNAWIAVTGSVVTNDNLQSVTLPLSAADNRFYRLRW
jgi:hypothetical protein